jgi:CBS domain containing-hemolysin-like protein
VEIDTLGGYLQYIKGTVPHEGDIIKADGCSFEILKMEGQSIEKVRLTIS